MDTQVSHVWGRIETSINSHQPGCQPVSWSAALVMSFNSRLVDKSSKPEKSGCDIMCVRCIRNIFGGYGQWTPGVTCLFMSLQVWLSRSRGLFYLFNLFFLSLSTDWLFFANTLKHFTIFSNSWLKKKNAVTYLLKLSSVCRLHPQTNIHIKRCKYLKNLVDNKD